MDFYGAFYIFFIHNFYAAYKNYYHKKDILKESIALQRDSTLNKIIDSIGFFYQSVFPIYFLYDMNFKISL